MSGASYRVIATVLNGQWTAHAVREETGERFGIDVTAPTEDEATTRLSSWLEWQREHTTALEALQQAERAYHRAIAGEAFATQAGAGAATRESLELVERARARLDDVRARRPL